MPQINPSRSLDSAWYGFLIVCFAVVGLAGLFGTYATQIPYQRGEAAQQSLDLLATAQNPADWDALRAKLATDQPDENAAILNQTNLDRAQRIAQARAATRARTLLEAADIALRVRVVLGVITLGATLFGCLLLGTAANQRKQR